MPRRSKVTTTRNKSSSSSTTTPPVPPLVTDINPEVEGIITTPVTTSDVTADVGVEATDADCIICLETIKIRGEIDSCLHQFCFDCIIKWSKVTNTCPVCKRDFLKVTEFKQNNKEKKKKKPKVVKIKPKPQRVEPQPMPIPDLYAYDIRMLFLHLTNMMWGSDDDSDYVDGEEDEEDEFLWDMSGAAQSPSPSVNLNDIYENGRHVIEILDDEAQPQATWEDDDDEIEFLSAPPPSSRRGPRGDSLFARVGTSSYRAAPSSSSSSTSNSSRAVPSDETNRVSNSRRRAQPPSSGDTSGASDRTLRITSSLRGELNSVPSTLPRTISEPSRSRKRGTLQSSSSSSSSGVVAGTGAGKDEEESEELPIKKRRTGNHTKRPSRISISSLCDTDDEEEEEEAVPEEEHLPTSGGKRRRLRRIRR